MSLDRSPWLTNDPEWLKQREVLWQALNSYQNEWGDKLFDWEFGDFDKKEKEAAYKHYFLTGNVPDFGRDWIDLILFHPAPDITIMRQIASAYDAGWLGQYTFAMSLPQRFYPLVELGLIKQQVLFDLALACHGQDYTEMAQLRQFEPQEELFLAMERLVDAEIECWRHPTPDIWPLELIQKHLFSVLPYIKEGHPEFDSIMFNLNSLCKHAAKFQPKKFSNNPQVQTQMVQEVKAFLLSDHVAPCVKAIALKHFKVAN